MLSSCSVEGTGLHINIGDTLAFQRIVVAILGSDSAALPKAVHWKAILVYCEGELLGGADVVLNKDGDLASQVGSVVKLFVLISISLISSLLFRLPQACRSHQLNRQNQQSL